MHLTYKLSKYEFLQIASMENLVRTDSSVTDPRFMLYLPSTELDKAEL